MHELSIAQDILNIVRQYVPEGQAAEVRSIRIRVGQLSGIVPESLDFCFGAIASGTSWQSAKLCIDRVSARAQCNSCGQRFEIADFAFLCPKCGSSDIRTLSGTDLQVVEVELEDITEVV
jgi:hydrogenase nickel incorporation protein HypA/HybF